MQLNYYDAQYIQNYHIFNFDEYLIVYEIIKKVF